MQRKNFANLIWRQLFTNFRVFMVYSLFFDLIRLSIRNQNCLTRQPSADEWGGLYNMAVKQSLVGICFAGVSSLKKSGSPFISTLSSQLYFKWLASAASIQERNELMNQRCIELQSMCSSVGFKSSILKGQGVASFYEDLSQLRQPGDIDVWIYPHECSGALSERRDIVVKYARSVSPQARVCYHHVDVDLMDDVEVELHPIPSWFYNYFTNRKWVKWQEEHFHKDGRVKNDIGLYVPAISFNIVYLLIHIYRHIFTEGIGLRQLLDYYFVLAHSTAQVRADSMQILTELGLRRFAAGVMHIESSLFHLQDEYLLCAPNRNDGEFILVDILECGNFGKYGNNYNKRSRNLVKNGLMHLQHRAKYMTYYPSEFLAMPFWKLWHFCWRKKKGYL